MQKKWPQKTQCKKMEITNANKNGPQKPAMDSLNVASAPLLLAQLWFFAASSIILLVLFATAGQHWRVGTIHGSLPLAPRDCSAQAKRRGANRSSSSSPLLGNSEDSESSKAVEPTGRFLRRYRRQGAAQVHEQERDRYPPRKETRIYSYGKVLFDCQFPLIVGCDMKFEFRMSHLTKR